MRLLSVLVLIAAFVGCDSSVADPDMDPTPRSPATYLVTFDATWSAATHPANFPGASAHFSPLVGATHAEGLTFWEVGEIASDGLRSIAETGATAIFQQEVAARASRSTLVEGGIVGVSPGAATAELTVTEAQPLATVVTMLAPSPDWFVGTSALDLRQGDDWVDRVEVSLVVYDAGTDDGASYTAANAPRTLRAPIAASDYAPLVGTSVGTMTFERQ